MAISGEGYKLTLLRCSENLLRTEKMLRHWPTSCSKSAQGVEHMAPNNGLISRNFLVEVGRFPSNSVWRWDHFPLQLPNGILHSTGRIIWWDNFPSTFENILLLYGRTQSQPSDPALDADLGNPTPARILRGEGGSRESLCLPSALFNPGC